MANNDTINRVYTSIRTNWMHPIKTLEHFHILWLKAGRAEEVFFGQSYRWMIDNIRPNTTVIDIGANIGDTAIYFAQFKEVKRVVAYEPVPFAYNLMVKQVKESGLKNKIITRNMALSAKIRQFIAPIGRKDVIGFNAEQLRLKDGIKIKAITLAEALKGKKNVAIKCDCEGAEEQLFNNVDIKNVYMIMVEWHGERSRRAVRRVLIGSKYRIVKDGPGHGHQGYICAKR